MTLPEISKKLRDEGYTANNRVYITRNKLMEPEVVSVLVTCSPFLLNDVMHELWLWLPSEYSVDKLDEQTIIIKNKDQ